MDGFGDYVPHSDQSVSPQVLYEFEKTSPEEEINSLDELTAQPPPRRSREPKPKSDYVTQDEMEKLKIQQESVLYAVDVDDDTVKQVKRIQDLTHHYESNVENPVTVCISGVTGSLRYINGIYRRIRDTTHDGRVTFRSAEPVSSGYGNVSGKYLYIYFTSSEEAWAVGMRIGSKGVIAYKQSTGNSPATGNHAWMITGSNGSFIDDNNIKCTVAGGFTVAPEDFDKDPPEVGELAGIPELSREEAEAIGEDSADFGSYIVRKSASSNNVVITVFVPGFETVHFRLEKVNEHWKFSGHKGAFASLDLLIKHYEQHPIIRVEGRDVMLSNVIN